MTDKTTTQALIDAMRELDGALLSRAYVEEQLEEATEQARAAQAHLEDLLLADLETSATLAQGGAIELTRHRLEILAGRNGMRIKIAPLEKARSIYQLARDLEAVDAF